VRLFERGGREMKGEREREREREREGGRERERELFRRRFIHTMVEGC